MINPVLTLLFDLFLVGSALAIAGAMIHEHIESRRPSVGSNDRTPHSDSSRERLADGRGRALRKVA